MKTLDVQDLYVDYRNETGSISAVKGISFFVEKGKITGIIGESGCGKSSVMMAVLGMNKRNAKICASKISVNGEEPAAGKNVAIVFQASLNCLNPSVTVGRQLEETVRACRKCSRKEARRRSLELMEMVGIRDGVRRMRQYPFELSGGMRQRVVIAAAVACEPDLILADEPTTALDSVVQAQILCLLRRIVRETGTSLLLVSHDPGVTAALCDHVYVMKDGEFIEDGDVRDIFYAPEKLYTEKLLKTKKGFLRTDMQDGEVLLHAENITKNYVGQERQRYLENRNSAAVEGVSGISLDLYRGETFALIGESGSGKSTFARVLSGIERMDSGEIKYCGRLMSAGKKNRNIQMVFQDPYASLNPCLTAEEALLEAIRFSAENNAERVERMLELTGISVEDAGKFPPQLSGGQRQRVGLARALITDPDLLICDEAFASLDTASSEKIMELLLKIQKERNLSCLFISHDIPSIQRFSRRMGVMYMGKMVEIGYTGEVCKDPWHPYTKMLLESVPKPDPFRAPKIEKAVMAFQKKSCGVSGKRGNQTSGCPFAGICGYMMERCTKEMPGSYRFGSRTVACFLYSEECVGNRNSSARMTSQI